jgi:hypothetical protein
MAFNRSNKAFTQERLSKDDIRLLLDLIPIAVRNEALNTVSPTRIELLIGKLKRMEKMT